MSHAENIGSGRRPPANRKIKLPDTSQNRSAYLSQVVFTECEFFLLRVLLLLVRLQLSIDHYLDDQDWIVEWQILQTRKNKIPIISKHGKGHLIEADGLF